ncbi:helix-turn-helix domain-containing protein [Sphingomonas solaris]|nr:helix-turn-helix domain-containing protein [Sphingomonas solaris]
MLHGIIDIRVGSVGQFRHPRTSSRSNICNVECVYAMVIADDVCGVNDWRHSLSRPALAALRGTRILDLLASFPERRFTLTEVARATGVNPASCLAILGELVQRGHLCRHISRKTYWLGPALIAAGTAATIANPIVARARTVAERLRGELGLPTLLSTRVGDEIVCVFSLPDDAGRTAGLRAGERVPLVPPVGASFMAWVAPDEVEAWIALRPDDGAGPVVRQLRETLALTRTRGFHVTLRRPEAEDIASILARAASGDLAPDFYRQVVAFVATLDVEASQPDMLDADAMYDTQLIASPIIDPETSGIYNLCLGGFPGPLAGTEIARLGQRLTASCVEIMKH